MTDLRTIAVWLHELYTALTEAGFTEDEALELTAYRCPIPPDLEDE